MASDPVAALQHWARQTVIFAIGLRNDLSDTEQAKLADAESVTVCENLWKEAQMLCVSNLVMMPKVYSKLVLKWVQENVPLTD